MIDSVDDATGVTAKMAVDLESQVMLSGSTKNACENAAALCAEVSQIMAYTISTAALQRQNAESVLETLSQVTGYLAESLIIAQARGWDSVVLNLSGALDKTETLDDQINQEMANLSELEQALTISRSVIDRLSEGLEAGQRLSETLQEQFSASRHDGDELTALITAG